MWHARRFGIGGIGNSLFGGRGMLARVGLCGGLVQVGIGGSCSGRHAGLAGGEEEEEGSVRSRRRCWRGGGGGVLWRGHPGHARVRGGERDLLEGGRWR